MKRKYQDDYPWKSERQYRARKEAEQNEDAQNAESDSGLFLMLVTFFFFFLKIAGVFGLFIYGGYLLSRKWIGEEADTFKIWALALCFTYLIFCVMFYL